MSKRREINKKKAEAVKLKDTYLNLCWMCTKCVATAESYCKWSKDLEPVKGWTAKEDPDAPGHYHITGCPEFVPDEPVFALAVNALRQKGTKRIFAADIRKSYGTVERATAKFILDYCKEHEDELTASGYDLVYGMWLAHRPRAQDTGAIAIKTGIEPCCGTCFHYRKIKTYSGELYGCTNEKHKGNVWTAYSDICGLWKRRPKQKQEEERKQKSYIDQYAGGKGGCKMMDCKYSGMMAGSFVDSTKSRSKCCDYLKYTGKCRTTGGKHKIVDGRCDLYQRDPEKRRKIMEQKKKRELKRLTDLVEGRNE